jgi:hypothetical protein
VRAGACEVEGDGDGRGRSHAAGDRVAALAEPLEEDVAA